MTIRHQIEVETFSLLLMAAAVGTSFAFFNNAPKIRNISLPVVAIVQVSPTPAPLPKAVVTSQTSPDGSKKLTMTQTTNKDNSKTFAFVVTDSTANDVHPIYTVTLTNETMSIPYNAFSPDNKYLFIQYNTKDGTQAWAMRADGQPINVTTNEQYYNVTSLFTQKYANLTYDQTTGWASETLLIIITKNADGSEGQSFWLEVPSKAIIPLATQF